MVEKGKQRYCIHHFTGGACVMCHFNPWKGKSKMIKSRELVVPDSCLNRAAHDEPLFVIMGRDVAAIAAIDAWIQSRIGHGKNGDNDAQILEARMVCSDIREYQARIAEVRERMQRTIDDGTAARQA